MTATYLFNAESLEQLLDNMNTHGKTNLIHTCVPKHYGAKAQENDYEIRNPYGQVWKLEIQEQPNFQFPISQNSNS